VLPYSSLASQAFPWGWGAKKDRGTGFSVALLLSPMETLAMQAVSHSNEAFKQKSAEFITSHSSRVQSEENKFASLTTFIDNFITKKYFTLEFCWW